MQRSLPAASAGLIMLDASSEPPLVAPAPKIVWSSSMNRMARPSWSVSAFITALRRSSKSPR